MLSAKARIPIRAHLAPLDAEQIKQNGRDRLAAGCHAVFADDSLLLITKATAGIIRRIDVRDV